MRYIVTGGAGFIGSNLADTLAQNHDVVIIDNLATVPGRANIEHLANHSCVTFIEGSVTDLDLLMGTFPGAGDLPRRGRHLPPGGDPLGAAVGEGPDCLKRGKHHRYPERSGGGEGLRGACCSVLKKQWCLCERLHTGLVKGGEVLLHLQIWRNSLCWLTGLLRMVLHSHRNPSFDQ